MKMGDKVPQGEFQTMGPGDDKPKSISSSDLFSGKKVVMFGIPGAYTSVCSAKHLPEYVSKADELHAAGIDTIACVATNDAYVMREWGQANNVQDKVQMLADGDCSWVKAAGLDQVLPNMGSRCVRFSLFADDGKVKVLNKEKPGAMSYQVSGPDNMLRCLKEM